VGGQRDGNRSPATAESTDTKCLGDFDAFVSGIRIFIFSQFFRKSFWYASMRWFETRLEAIAKMSDAERAIYAARA
jgi:hypothetical protein